MPIGSVRAGVVGERDAIPDSDLTQYNETDPDGEITVVDASSWEGRFATGANSTARLYKAEDITQYDTVSYRFDVTLLTYTAYAANTIGWATDGDSSLANTTPAGVSIGAQPSAYSSDPPAIMAIGAGKISDRTVVTTISESNTYGVETTYDTTADEFTVEVFDGSDTSLGTATKQLPSSLSHHYASMGDGQSYANEGDLDFDVSNVSFSAP